MGEIVLAAKCTHVPTMLMSEQDGPVKGKRARPPLTGISRSPAAPANSAPIRW